MHPAFLYWWKYGKRHGEWHAWSACGTAPGFETRSEAHYAGGHRHHHDDGGLGSAFGVRRPLRFLAYKLDLNEDQVGQLARILDELKTERAQAEVDSRRTTAAFADALEHEAFDERRAGEGAGLRVESAERLRRAVVGALQRIHALLNSEQRERLAYLIRTGALAL